MRKTPLDAVHELDAAFNEGNLDRVLSFYDDNAAIVIDPNRVISGKDSLRRAFIPIITLHGTAEQHQTHIIESGNIALFTSKWSFTWQVNGETKCRESYATTVFRRIDSGEWLIVIDNSFGPAVLDS